jgi:hypothetical protein
MRREAFLLLFPLKTKVVNQERAKKQRGLQEIPLAVRVLGISAVTPISLKDSM